ncbi:unnamed protein product [Heterosigma akashiwo]
MKEIVVTCAADDQCAICLDLLTAQAQVYAKGQPVRLWCRCRRFRFHELCLRTHLLTARTCPMCRGTPQECIPQPQSQARLMRSKSSQELKMEHDDKGGKSCFSFESIID